MQGFAFAQLGVESGKRHQKLGGHRVAPDLLAWELVSGRFFDVRQSRVSKPQVREFMGQGEHLRRFRVRAVDEDQGGEGIGKGEAAKLAGIERAVVVAAHNPADHYEHTGLVGLPDEQPQSIDPRRALPVGSEVESERFAHLGRHGLRIHLDPGAADEIEFRLLPDANEVSVPALPLLASVDRIQQVRARSRHLLPGERAEVRNGNRLFRRLREEQVADGHMNGPGERLHLLQGGLRLAVLPLRQPLEPGRKVRLHPPGTLPRPADKLGIDRDAGHANASTAFSASGTRISPEMSLGSSVSRRAARLRDSWMLAVMRSSIGAMVFWNTCTDVAAGRQNR